jgi:hypothetical protein
MRTIISMLMLMACLAGCVADDGGPAMASREECMELRAIEAKLAVAAAAPAKMVPDVAAELARHEKSLSLLAARNRPRAA